MERIIKNSMIVDFKNYLRSDEKSDNTIEKYLRDVRAFVLFAEAREISKAVVMEFKASLVESYEVTSANSIIAAVNAFLRFMGWMDCCIKQFKVQKKAFCSEEKELTKEEYVRLVNAAKQKGNERLNLILQTICGTGIENWIYNHRKEFTDPERQKKVTPGKKPRIDKLVFHGLRHSYNQNREKWLEGDPRKRQKLSQGLGHRRLAVNDIYRE